MSYQLFTSARNEVSTIRLVLDAVARQTIKPVRWVIVDDNSTDATGGIVREYANRYGFIVLRERTAEANRSFGAQYRALMEAYNEEAKVATRYVGFLDADIELDRDDYYEAMMAEFDRNTDLGLVGGLVFDKTDAGFANRCGNRIESVAGGVQFFARTLFDEIGGYVPLEHGGSDWLAQLMVEMRGYKGRSLPDFRVKHHRPTSSAGGLGRGLFRLGLMDADFGSHPAFEILKCARRLPERPYLLGGMLRFLGYCWALARRQGSPVGQEVKSFLRSQQIRRVRALFGR